MAKHSKKAPQVQPSGDVPLHGKRKKLDKEFYEKELARLQLELVKLDNCKAASGGTTVANFHWGFWYTKDANGLLDWK